MLLKINEKVAKMIIITLYYTKKNLYKEVVELFNNQIWISFDENFGRFKKEKKTIEDREHILQNHPLVIKNQKKEKNEQTILLFLFFIRGRRQSPFFFFVSFLYGFHFNYYYECKSKIK